MPTDNIHVAEKGRNLEEEAVVPAAAPVVAATPVNQVEPSAMTYVDDGKGNIIAGPGVGIPPQTEQPVAAQPATTTQQIAFTPTNVGEETGPVTKEQPSETVVANNEQGVTAPIAAPSEAVRMQDDMAKKIAEVESGKDKPQQFEFNWDSGISFADVVRSSDRPKRAILDDYMKWAQATGNPINWYEINQVLGDTNIDNNVHQDEVDEKKAARKAKWDALGTFLTHLGNAVGAAGWGGSVKLHDPVELSERQRKLQEATLERRRAYNKDLMNLYMNQDRNYWLNQKNLGQAGLIQQKIDDAKREQIRKDEKNKSDIARTESATALNNERSETERTMRPVKVKTEEARQNKLNTPTPTKKGRPSSRGSKTTVDHEGTWASNTSKYPEFTKQFMAENNIHGFDKKNWTLQLIKQYNAQVKEMEGKKGSKPQRTKVNY